MKRLVAVAVAVAALALSGCQWRHVEREVVEVDGQRFICTKTVNEISGNETEGECEPLAAQP